MLAELDGGCSEIFLLGNLLLKLDHPIDLVDLDTQDAFAQYLQREGVLLRVG